MAKLKVMSQLQLEVIFLFIMSFSGAFLLYVLYLEFQRHKHLSFIKDVMASHEDEAKDLLELKKHTELHGTSFLAKVRKMMLHAGLNFSVYLFLFIFMMFCFGVGFSFSTFLQHWSGMIIGSVFGGVLFWMFIQALTHRRKKEFNRALSIAISVLVKMMKNGIGFEQALVKSISVSNSKVFKSIFSNFFREKNTLGEMEAFKSLNNYVDSKELLVFALSIKIGRESGGQFSNTLEKVEKTISYRKKMQEKVDVVTREGSVGSYIVVGIAIFLYFTLNGNFDGKLHAYFMDSEYGRFQLLGIAMWVFLGMVVNKIITKVEK